MTTQGFKGLTGLRKQIIENCYFFTTTNPGGVSIIITREPIGTYKAIVLVEARRRRDVVLSSDAFDTVTKALEQLLTKSANAVQQFIATNGFGRLPSDVDTVDDDVVSSVSSYIDDADKENLADSSLSLESELESTYESPSEDGDGWAGKDRRSRWGDARTVRRDSRSRSRSRSRDRTPVYSKAPAPPARYLVHPGAPHHRKDNGLSCPPGYSGTVPPGATGNGNVQPSISNYQAHAMHNPPQPMSGPRIDWPEFRRLPDVRLVPDSRGAHWQRALEQAHKNHPGQGYISLDSGKIGPQHPLQAPHPPPNAELPMHSGVHSGTENWSQIFGAPNPGMPACATMPPPMSWPPVHPNMMPQRPPLSQQVSSVNNAQATQAKGSPATGPVMNSSASSTASSSASSTLTLTTSPSIPPVYTPASSPAKIDYRLVIRTPSTADRMGAVHGIEQHRVIARTPPTRSAMRALALRIVLQNPELFRSSGLNTNVPSCLHAVVTRAVFSAGQQGREESYHLAAYGDDDFSRLCEGMNAMMGGGGTEGPRAWPLFEVVVSNDD